jgi:hypothetical protein
MRFAKNGQGANPNEIIFEAQRPLSQKKQPTYAADGQPQPPIDMM